MPSIADLNKKYAGKTYTSPPPKPSFLQKVGNFFGTGPGSLNEKIAKPVIDTFNQGVDIGAQGIEKTASGINHYNPGEIGAGLMKFGSGVATSVSSPLAPVFKPAGDTVNTVSDKISNDPRVQKFATSPAGQTTSNIADFVGDTANVAGTLLGTEAGANAFNKYAGGVHPIFTRSTPILDPNTIKTPELQVAEQNVGQAKTQLAGAQTERINAAQTGTQGLKTLIGQTGQYESGLGKTFGEKMINQEKLNPGAKLNITTGQQESLNGLKESRNFQLPENLDQEKLTPTTESGRPLNFTDPVAKAKFEAQLKQSQGQTSTSLSHTQASDLIRRLNKNTFKADPNSLSGFSVDERVIGVRNEIRQAASKAFGPEFDKIYSEYSQGQQALQDFNDLINLDQSPDKVFARIQKLGESPEGKIIIQDAIDNFKAQTGIDLNDPVTAMHNILDKQAVLEEAQGNLKDANKELSKTQNEIAKQKKAQEIKNSTFFGRHPFMETALKYEAKRAIWQVSGGLVLAYFLSQIRKSWK